MANLYTESLYCYEGVVDGGMYLTGPLGRDVSVGVVGFCGLKARVDGKVYAARADAGRVDDGCESIYVSVRVLDGLTGEVPPPCNPLISDAVPILGFI